MIAPGANARVYVAYSVTDMRKGTDDLMAPVESSLRQKQASGSVFAFRGRRGDRIKLLFLG
jgi:transposase